MLSEGDTALPQAWVYIYPLESRQAIEEGETNSQQGRSKKTFPFFSQKKSFPEL